MKMMVTIELSKKIWLLDGMFLLLEAWELIKETGIRNCWRKAGLLTAEKEDTANSVTR